MRRFSKTIKFASEKLTLLAAGVAFASQSANAEDVSFLQNQLGYYGDAQKEILVRGSQVKDFELLDDAGSVVFRGELSESLAWDMSGDEVKTADLSSFKQPGKFYLKVGEKRQLNPINIAADPWSEALKSSIKAYYYNRAGVALEERFAGIYERPASHPDNIVYIHESAADKKRPVGTVVASTKGWFDAGDFNKYIVNSAISMYTLLKALEEYPKTFKTLNINIPESENALPDLLDEAMWNLDWMLTMQDPNDGGVYHKLTTKRFSDSQMPHTAYKSRYMVLKSHAATMDFAGTMAYASRVLAVYPDFKDLSKQMVEAAEYAWKWGVNNRDKQYDQPKDIHTGTYRYPSDTFKDEEFWAAAELYLVTGKKSYLKTVKKFLPEQAPTPDWSDVTSLAVFSLLDSKKTPVDIRSKLELALLLSADEFVKQHKKSAYGVAMTGKDFVWGSNGTAMNKAVLLLQAAKLKDDPDYVTAAQGLLDYVLGKNPMDNSYLTGYGYSRSQNIHHRQSEADGIDEPVPGFLAGGPHLGKQDAGDCKNYGVSYKSTEYPAMTYLDEICSYATNEVTINWNAPLVYVLTNLRQRYLAE